MDIGSTSSISSHFSELRPSARRAAGVSESGDSPVTAAEPATKVELSPEAQKLLNRDEVSQGDKEASDKLTDQEQKQVAELKARDGEVRAHERAHVAASGGHTKGGIKYDLQRGPDNKQYAVGGHVEIDTTPIAGDPSKTIQKAETVRRAALAPADPSGADRQVAAKAARTITQARADLATEQEEVDVKADVDAEASEYSESASVHSSYALAAYAAA